MANIFLILNFILKYLCKKDIKHIRLTNGYCNQIAYQYMLLNYNWKSHMLPKKVTGIYNFNDEIKLLPDYLLYFL